jgi:hypothetical protein
MTETPSRIDVEKQVCEDDNGPFVRIIVYNCEGHISYITHHNTEEIADEFMLKIWSINEPPPIGRRVTRNV